MSNKLVFDPPDTPFPTHKQKVTLMALVGKKGAKAYKEVTLKVNADIQTATQEQMDDLIARMSDYPDLEIKWRRKGKRMKKSVKKYSKR